MWVMGMRCVGSVFSAVSVVVCVCVSVVVCVCVYAVCVCVCVCVSLASRLMRCSPPLAWMQSSPEIMFRKVMLWDGEGDDAPPVFQVDDVHYIYVKAGSMYWGATTKENVSPSLVLELLNRLFWITNDYVGHVSEESVRKNFVLIYELLDEILDHGFPQNSSTERLKDFIAMEPAISRPKSRLSVGAAAGPSEVIKSVLNTSRTGAKEEIFVDIVEKTTAIFGSSGHLKASSIVGSVQVKSYLHGNPMIRLGLSDNLILSQDGSSGDHQLSYGSGDDMYGPVVFDTYSLHENVDQEGFTRDKVLELVPPEGHFSLLTYRSTRPFRPPFRVYPILEDDAYSDEKITLMLRIRAEYDASKIASGVEVVVPFPPNVLRAHIQTDTENNDATLLSVLPGKTFTQRAEWYDRDSKIKWLLKNLKGGREHTLRVRLTVEPGQAHMVKHEMGPIMVHFVLPGKPTLSGLDVKYMKIMRDTAKGQGPARWFRAVAVANTYQIRTE